MRTVHHFNVHFHFTCSPDSSVPGDLSTLATRYLRQKEVDTSTCPGALAFKMRVRLPHRHLERSILFLASARTMLNGALEEGN